MRSIWSFWTKPWRASLGWNWVSDHHHLFAWALSFESARRHYPETSLITDDEGARILVDGIGLGFDHVSTELNSLSDQDPGLWMLGKLYAYRLQEEPFIHMDTDVFIWKRLPERIEAAPVFAQAPEQFVVGASHYRPDEVQRIMAHQPNGWIPKEWAWCLSFGSPQPAACCGILGGNRADFIRYYADLAIRMIEDPCNRAGWSLLTKSGDLNVVVLLEQYHLAACVAYHRNRPKSPFREIEIQYLFDSWDQLLNPNIAAKLCYTHLWAGAKQNQLIAERMRKRIQRDYPEHYERCIHYRRLSRKI
jgi:hypothetical protein